MHSKQVLLVYPEGDISIDRQLIESHPDSVIGSYLLTHPDINELDIKKCDCNFLNFETFMRIYNFLSKKSKFSDLTLEDIRILDLSGLVTPSNIKFQYFLRAQMNLLYEQLEDLLENKISFMQVTDQKYTDMCNSLESFYLLRLKKFIIQDDIYIIVETHTNPKNHHATYLGYIHLNSSTYEKMEYDFDKSINLLEVLKRAIYQFYEFIKRTRPIDCDNYNVMVTSHRTFFIEDIPIQINSNIRAQRKSPYHYFFRDISSNDQSIIKKFEKAEKYIIKPLSNNVVNKILIKIHQIINQIEFKEFAPQGTYIIINI
jgi:hypothetical protein